MDPEPLFSAYPEYRVPEDRRQAFLRERTACLVGRKLADRLGFRIGDRIVLQGDIFPVNLELTVRAIYDALRDNENLLFHFDYLKEALPGYRGESVSTFVICAASAEDVPRISKAVDAMFRNAPQQTKTETEKAFELSFLALLGNVKLFLLSISSAITFTILLVSGNTMAMSVRERVREIGVLKTLGFGRGTILGVILSEAVILSLAGGLLGLFLAWGLLGMMREMPSLATDMSRLRLPPMVWGLCLHGPGECRIAAEADAAQEVRTHRACPARAGTGGPRGPFGPHTPATLGRPGTARGDRPGDRHRSGSDSGGRAESEQRVRQDGGDGDSRSSLCPRHLQDPLPG